MTHDVQPTDRDASVQVFWKADTKVELQELWGGKGRETDKKIKQEEWIWPSRASDWDVGQPFLKTERKPSSE